MGFHDDYSPRLFDGTASSVPRPMTWEEDQKEREMYHSMLAMSEFKEWRRRLERQSNSWELAIDQMGLDRGGESTIEIEEGKASESVRYDGRIACYL